jgi:hypothetical protein
MAYIFQAFPQMIYHLIYGERIVHTEADLKTFLAAGWAVTPDGNNGEIKIKKQIAWHESEIKRLSSRLVSNVQPEIVENIVLDSEEKRRPGRPRKE